MYSEDEADDFSLTKTLAELNPDMRKSIERWRKGFLFCTIKIELDEAIEQWRRWVKNHQPPSDVTQYVENVIDTKSLELAE